jgi:hypothetical protein
MVVLRGVLEARQGQRIETAVIQSSPPGLMPFQSLTRLRGAGMVFLELGNMTSNGALGFPACSIQNCILRTLGGNRV